MSSITDATIIHHVIIVLLLLWMLNSFNYCHPIAYFISLVYLYMVHETYVMRLRRKLQYEEKRNSNQRRVLSDSESVRWLNNAMEKIWPICMEDIVSQKILLPIVPWFLQKYKPWTAKEVTVQHLYLGRSPPMFTEMRVLSEPCEDDDLVLELGMNFLTADDMDSVLAIKLRKRLGLGMGAKLHLLNMHIEGKGYENPREATGRIVCANCHLANKPVEIEVPQAVLPDTVFEAVVRIPYDMQLKQVLANVGVKFIRQWPYISRLRVCFVEPPFFHMTAKPIFSHGLNVTEIPGITGWLDKLLGVAFEQTLVEPNMLVVDVEKFVSPQPENWFSVDAKEIIAHAIVEVLEADELKPSDLNGLADPYVKGQLGAYRFRTEVKKKTLSPKWREEFRIPLCSWESPILKIEVHDKDHVVDDKLGNCSINVFDLRGRQRNDIWLPLQNIKVGRLHLAITVVDIKGNGKEYGEASDEPTFDSENEEDLHANESVGKESFSKGKTKKSKTVLDKFEPIVIEGQQETGIFVHHPGSEVARIWETRKGRSLVGSQIPGGSGDLNVKSTGSGSGSGSGQNEGSSSGDENGAEGNISHSRNRIRRGFHKIGSVFHRSPKGDDDSVLIEVSIPSLDANLKPVNTKDISSFVVEGPVSSPSPTKSTKIDGKDSSEGSNVESPGKRENMKGMAKGILKQAGKSAQGIKHALSRKSRKAKDEPESLFADRDTSADVSDSSDDEAPMPSVDTPGLHNDSFESREDAHQTMRDGDFNSSTEILSMENTKLVDACQPPSDLLEQTEESVVMPVLTDLSLEKSDATL